MTRCGRPRAAGRKLYGFAEHGVTSTFLGTSAGLRARYDQPTGRLELNAKSADLTRSAWAGASTRDFTDVDVAALDAGLAERLSWQSRRVELPAGRYETLLPPTAVADLLIYLYWSAGARDAGEGRTVFSKPGGGTRVGERLSPLPLDLFSDPAYPGLECAPFVVAHASGRDSSVFDNGLRRPGGPPGSPRACCRRCTRAALLGRGGRAAGHPVGGQPDHDRAGRVGVAEQMIASTKRGLLLTCLWYIRQVDPQTLLLTGLTRDGVYLVEEGEVTGAVNNFRFNESPVAMLVAGARGGRHVADAAARVGRLLQPRRDAAAAGRGVQHVLGQPGELAATTRSTAVAAPVRACPTMAIAVVRCGRLGVRARSAASLEDEDGPAHAGSRCTWLPRRAGRCPRTSGTGSTGT